MSRKEKKSVHEAEAETDLRKGQDVSTEGVMGSRQVRRHGCAAVSAFGTGPVGYDGGAAMFPMGEVAPGSSDCNTDGL